MRWEIQLSQNHTLQAPTTLQWPSVKVSNSKPMGPRFETRFHCRSTEHMNLVYTKSDFVGQTVSLKCIADAWTDDDPVSQPTKAFGDWLLNFVLQSGDKIHNRPRFTLLKLPRHVYVQNDADGMCSSKTSDLISC
ncbi:hypothetical protein AVEN_262261-1 [Araneus ventricosus]|uniref:Uncharacterized protein n=1 Tax=Araneus ventricosus TaxID=182803 RepID=A0A4Y2NM13_ARAVE|nr:hypothetical protein AVEN_262261-1 [Araneus ventricosus]